MWWGLERGVGVIMGLCIICDARRGDVTKLMALLVEQGMF